MATRKIKEKPDAATPTADAMPDARTSPEDEKPDAGTPPAGTTPEIGQPPASAKPDAGTPPEKGAFTLNRVLLVKKPLMKGADVKAVQEVLISKRFGCGAEGANGVYNATMALTVRHFQAQNRLIVTGKVDKFTARKLGAAWEEPKT